MLPQQLFCECRSSIASLTIVGSAQFLVDSVSIQWWWELLSSAVGHLASVETSIVFVEADVDGKTRVCRAVELALL